LVSLNAQAVSFDCKKANSYVEKRICEDDKRLSYGLSKLDDHLDRAYRIILQRTDNPDRVKAEQRQWLKVRNACKDYDCIEKAYIDRLNTIHKPVPPPTTIVPSNGKSIESHLFPSEAMKLEVLRKIANERSFRSAIDLKTNYCPTAIQDLNDGKFVAVEPDIRAETEYDPRLAVWHKCDGENLTDHPEAGYDNFYSGFHDLGMQPYRYYRLDFDGNIKNGLEDLIYYETGATAYNPKATIGNSGFTWVDIDTCTAKAGVSVRHNRQHGVNPDNHFKFSLIVSYKNRYNVLEISPVAKSDDETKYEINMTQISSMSKREGCFWIE